MKACETRLLAFISKAQQFVIPIYQRNYSWTEDQCRKLWDDIIKAGSSDAIKGHFIGSIMYIEDGLSSISSKSPCLVIDGQQRLTTVSLLLAALRDAIGDNEPVEGFSARKISGYYLVNDLESGLKRYKLLLSETDRDALLQIMGAPEPKEPSEAISANFKFFQDKIAKCGSFEALCRGLEKLTVVDIALSRDQDNPQLIFESMNSTGLELSQADLIRNYLLMDLSPGEQDALYAGYWRPMEWEFGQNAYQTEFDFFIRHFLSYKMGDIPRLENIYKAFKQWHAHELNKGSGISEALAEVRRFASHYCRMALGKEPDAELRLAFNDLADLKATPAYPMLLEWYEDYSAGLWPKQDFLEALRLAESYVWRRAVCGIATNSLNNTFLAFNRRLDKGVYLESVKAEFLLLGTYKRFPRDEEFKSEIQARNLYANRARYWIRRLENFGHKEPISLADYSIEHIMPQNKSLPPEWQAELGPDWERVHEQWLHTLGNLTLTGYNSEYSDKPFKQKRDMNGGFRQSHLFLNQGLGDVETWNEDAMLERGSRLAERALRVWPRPELDRPTLEKHAPKRSASTGYTLEDHPNLLLPAMRPLFEALRKAILALEPSVKEEFLKLYVAYKADTNFVDIVPQKTALCLQLNMDYADLSDPKGIAKDVSHLHRWGNGKVEVKLATLADMPYVVDLIKQALDVQIKG